MGDFEPIARTCGVLGCIVTEFEGGTYALVFKERTDDAPTLTRALEEARSRVMRIAASLAVVQHNAGIRNDPTVPWPPEAYVRDKLNFGLCEVVYCWARGVPFADISALTCVQEGSIVRCITRLDETCREVRNIARVIGDPLLFRKMEAASELIKRDIVFATSLYVG